MREDELEIESVEPGSSGNVDLERRVRELESALADAERRNEAWLSTVSHDLRGPLTLVMGYAENLLRHTRPSKETTQSIHDLEAIVMAARRLNKMVGQVVDGARIEGNRLPLRLRSTELAPLVQTCVRTSSRIYPTHHFRVDLARDLQVKCDARATESIVGALLSNAAVFSPVGSQIEVTGRVTDGRVQLSVTDPGLGFTEAEVERAFEPRFRSERARDARREGLGVSLWICRALADRLGGELTVQSPGPDRGTTASLILPFFSDELAADELATAVD